VKVTVAGVISPIRTTISRSAPNAPSSPSFDRAATTVSPRGKLQAVAIWPQNWIRDPRSTKPKPNASSDRVQASSDDWRAISWPVPSMNRHPMSWIMSSAAGVDVKRNGAKWPGHRRCRAATCRRRPDSVAERVRQDHLHVRIMQILARIVRRRVQARVVAVGAGADLENERKALAEGVIEDRRPAES
jgi:hypothetical protein